MALGTVYERNGRFAEAEVAFAKAAAEGSQQTRRAALAALDRVILARESAGPWQQLHLGEMYEEQGRWADAQSAYKSVLETGPAAMKTIAQQRLRSIAENQEGTWEHYVQPVLSAAGVAVVTVAGAVLLYVVLGPPVGWYGRRRGRHSLVIGSFVPSTSGQPRIGWNFTDVMAAMHERMEAHFRPRIGIGDPKLPALVSSQSAELVELIGTLNAPAVPLLNWFAQKLNQPAYRISGFVTSARTDVRVVAKLEHRGNTVGRWNKTVHVRDWFQCEQDLAYEILLTLKEYVDDHAS
jgi:tetratricopeptide (TPR) repeat protein